MVDCYYQMQDNRIRAAGQIREMRRTEEPHAVLTWFDTNSARLENYVKLALKRYAESQHMGKWALNVCGIGPVISAGLLAHIDINKAPTVGHIWAFAGLDPTKKWEKGQKRPWNPALKTLCWKIGESFVKVSGNEKAFYGKLYIERKLQEIERNDNGEYAEQAKAAISVKRFGDDTQAKAWCSGCFPKGTVSRMGALEQSKRAEFLKSIKGEPGSGVNMLPPAHIHARATRWVVKIFLAHWHAEAFRKAFGKEPPVPYVVAHLGHTHIIEAEATNPD